MASNKVMPCVEEADDEPITSCDSAGLSNRKISLRNGVMQEDEARPFCNNSISTAKYTVASFIPKFFFESFRKLANAYFLLVSCLQCVKQISNTDGMPVTGGTLLFILLVDAFFSVLEDARRHRADKIANSNPCHIFDPHTASCSTLPTSRIRVGDVVQILNYEVVPADVLILGVAGKDSNSTSRVCYVETKSLDGETNLKLRHALECCINKVRVIVCSREGTDREPFVTEWLY